LNVVRTAGAAGVTGYALPDEGVIKRFFPVACDDEADQNIRCDACFFTHRAP